MRIVPKYLSCSQTTACNACCWLRPTGKGRRLQSACGQRSPFIVREGVVVRRRSDRAILLCPVCGKLLAEAKIHQEKEDQVDLFPTQEAGSLARGEQGHNNSTGLSGDPGSPGPGPVGDHGVVVESPRSDHPEEGPTSGA